LFARWRAWGQFLFKELTLDAAQETNQVRVYHLYLPIFAWCLDIVHRLQRDARRKHHGVIIGMQCPQGGGKTTLTTALQRLFALENRQCVSLSIDDFYLTRREQEALAKAFPENPLLESRGNPGTHDITLALQTLDRLVTAPGTEDQSSLAVPRYDKSAFQGRGDRAPPEQWHCYQRPVDVVFLEGWCLGFRPLEFHHRPAEMDPALLRNLIQVDRFLAQDFCRLYPLLDAFIVIALDGSSLKEALQTVYQWRLQAEQQMRAAGRPAMTDEQVYAFVDKFMPAYQAYLSDLYESPPLTGDASRELRVGIDGTRAPTRLFLRS
jgi:D-glycerate 3-kinase